MMEYQKIFINMLKSINKIQENQHNNHKYTKDLTNIIKQILNRQNLTTDRFLIFLNQKITTIFQRIIQCNCYELIEHGIDLLFLLAINSPKISVNQFILKALINKIPKNSKSTEYKKKQSHSRSVSVCQMVNKFNNLNIASKLHNYFTKYSQETIIWYIQTILLQNQDNQQILLKKIYLEDIIIKAVNHKQKLVIQYLFRVKINGNFIEILVKEISTALKKNTNDNHQLLPDINSVDSLCILCHIINNIDKKEILLQNILFSIQKYKLIDSIIGYKYNETILFNQVFQTAITYATIIFKNRQYKKLNLSKYIIDGYLGYLIQIASIKSYTRSIQDILQQYFEVLINGLNLLLINIYKYGLESLIEGINLFNTIISRIFAISYKMTLLLDKQHNNINKYYIQIISIFKRYLQQIFSLENSRIKNIANLRVTFLNLLAYFIIQKDNQKITINQLQTSFLIEKICKTYYLKIQENIIIFQILAKLYKKIKENNQSQQHQLIKKVNKQIINKSYQWFITQDKINQQYLECIIQLLINFHIKQIQIKNTKKLIQLQFIQQLLFNILIHYGQLLTINIIDKLVIVLNNMIKYGINYSIQKLIDRIFQIFIKNQFKQNIKQQTIQNIFNGFFNFNIKNFCKILLKNIKFKFNQLKCFHQSQSQIFLICCLELLDKSINQESNEIYQNCVQQIMVELLKQKSIVKILTNKVIDKIIRIIQKMKGYLLLNAIDLIIKGFSSQNYQLSEIIKRLIKILLEKIKNYNSQECYESVLASSILKNIPIQKLKFLIEQFEEIFDMIKNQTIIQLSTYHSITTPTFIKQYSNQLVCTDISQGIIPPIEQIFNNLSSVYLSYQYIAEEKIIEVSRQLFRNNMYMVVGPYLSTLGSVCENTIIPDIITFCKWLKNQNKYTQQLINSLIIYLQTYKRAYSQDQAFNHLKTSKVKLSSNLQQIMQQIKQQEQLTNIVLLELAHEILLLLILFDSDNNINRFLEIYQWILQRYNNNVVCQFIENNIYPIVQILLQSSNNNSSKDIEPKSIINKIIQFLINIITKNQNHKQSNQIYSKIQTQLIINNQQINWDIIRLLIHYPDLISKKMEFYIDIHKKMNLTNYQILPVLLKRIQQQNQLEDIFKFLRYFSDYIQKELIQTAIILIEKSLKQYCQVLINSQKFGIQLTDKPYLDISQILSIMKQNTLQGIQQKQFNNILPYIIQLMLINKNNINKQIQQIFRNLIHLK